MKKFIGDLLKTSDKWSFKRVTALYVLNIAILYIFTPLFISTFQVLEFVFWGLITYSATMVGMTLKQKMTDALNSVPKKEESGNSL